MKQHAAIVIAALMITSMAFAISTINVSAAHDQTPTIDETTVKGETSMILTITVANAGPAAINNVRITVPSTFSEFAPVIKIPKGNIAELDTIPPNEVTLPAGTLIWLAAATGLTAPENTPVIIENGVQISWEPIPLPGVATLMENLKAKTSDSLSINLVDDENFELVESSGGTLTYFGESAIFTTNSTVAPPGTITVTAPTETATFTAALYDAEGVLLLEGPTFSGDTVGVKDAVDFTTGVAASTTYTVKITDASEGEYTLVDDGNPQGSGTISVAAGETEGEDTFTTTPGVTAPGTITVTATSPTADFTAALYDAEGTTELVAPTLSTGDDLTPDTVVLTHEYAAMTDYVVKITATEGVTYNLADDGTPAGSETISTSVVGGLVRLVADTMAIRTGVSDVVLLPESTLVQLIMGTTFAMTASESITTVDEVDITDSVAGTFVATAEAATNTIYRVMPGNEVTVSTVPVEKKVVIPAGAVLEATGMAATLFDNTNVRRGEGKTLTLDLATELENQPKNWMQYDDEPDTWSIEWKGIGDNQIASGANIEFPFAVTTPSTSDTYNIIVRTTDTAGDVIVKEVTITVDATDPTVELAVSPEWAMANTKVAITVTASEPLAKLDNVMVKETNAPEDTQVPMSPNADKTVWKGTYTTGDNEDRDGIATVSVFGFEDLIGNEGEDNTIDFNVDRMAPPTPDLSAIDGFPETPATNDATWFIEGNAQDNYMGSLMPLEEGMVKIRVGAKTYTVTSGDSGYFYKSITLAEGTQEVGIRYIDLAGNAGEENAENVTLDTMAPSIKWGKIAGKALVDGIQINNNAPTITLTISDAGLGVDNWDFNATDNTGYSVQLLDENEDVIDENLVNALEHDNNVLEFENALPELGDSTYYIYAVVGDNWQMDNALIEFVIDTLAPSAPSVDAAYEITSTVDAPLVVKDASRTIAGTAEAGADITVYGTVDTTEKALCTATAGSDDKWTATFTLTAGSNTKIEVSATDEAGNEGSRELYGWMLADASAPSVTLAEVPDTTDKTSITISGTVSKDAWEDWSEITLTVQVGVGKVEVPCVGGSYEYSVALSEGPNTIVVQATDDIGNASAAATDVVERTVTPWAIYAIILVIIALIMAAIAIFRKKR